ncbi:dienelactone hydrolase family protein [Myxococcota bacterium]|nr:dienelactone hydrolase family protein [Myxococcota bacterium]
MEIQTERVKVQVEGGTMGGYLARPAGAGPWPGVLVFMEIFGVNGHIRDVVERVAAEGYVALAPDFFHRTGPGVEFAYDEQGFEQGFALLNQLVADEMIADSRAALALLRSREDVNGDRVGAMGFCIGGHMTYLTACETDVKAAASFYGGGIAAAEGPGAAESTLGRTPKISGRLLCLFGDRDDFIPGDQVEAIREALSKAGTDSEVVVYPGADHGFFCDQRESYDSSAAADAWQRVKNLFAQTLGA